MPRHFLSRYFSGFLSLFIWLLCSALPASFFYSSCFLLCLSVNFFSLRFPLFSLLLPLLLHNKMGEELSFWFFATRMVFSCLCKESLGFLLIMIVLERLSQLLHPLLIPDLVWPYFEKNKLC